jgi:hypothetical protein
MRSIIFILALSLLASCKSQKQVVSDKTLAVDSVARSEHHRTMAVIDSAIRNIDFSFDTLKINIERPYLANDTLGSQPSALGSQTEIIRIKAVRGRVIDQRRVHRDSVEAYNRLDTVAYHQSAAETSTEHTATTRLYNPPDGSTMFIITILVIGCLLSVFYRKR